jgi:hypothetical protein
VDAHDEGRRSGEDLKDRSGQDGDVSVAVAQRVHQRRERSTTLSQPRVTRRVEEDLVLSHSRAIQQQHILLSELFEEQTYATSRD